jgi:hypothetical protein
MVVETNLSISRAPVYAVRQVEWLEKLTFLSLELLSKLLGSADRQVGIAGETYLYSSGAPVSAIRVSR